MQRLTSEHMTKCKFLVCDFLPEDPIIYLYHTEYPRFFVAAKRNTIGRDVAYEFQIAEFIDVQDVDGNLINDEVFQEVVKNMASSFGEYLDFYTANRINLKRFSVDN